MRISGFTFIRDGVRLRYPFVESIRSALPLVDEFIVVIGDGDDGTREQIEAIDDPKITIVDTVWNVGTPKGYVYAQQKMTGLFRCTGDHTHGVLSGAWATRSGHYPDAFCEVGLDVLDRQPPTRSCATAIRT